MPTVLRAALVLALLTVTTACGSASRDQAAPPPSASTPAGPASAVTGPAPSSAAPVQVQVPVPPGVTAGIAVFDRQAGAFVVQQRAEHRFRSASLVKLLIVLDYLWDRGPGYTIPAGDRGRLDVMLRGSDDAAATSFWRGAGYGQVVTRMTARLGLKDTAPPPAARPGFWGYTEVSAADLVRIYRYLLEAAPAPVRDYVMGNLRKSTRCATDRYDQSFGIPTAFGPPWAVKQGWSGFGDRPANPCVAAATAAWVEPSAGVFPAAVDLVGEVLHTTGTVGADDRWIVAVLTVHRDGTPFATAATALTTLTRTLPLS
jgi:hypothetical protein